MKKNWIAMSLAINEMFGRANVIIVSNYKWSNKVANYALTELKFTSDTDIGKWNVTWKE